MMNKYGLKFKLIEIMLEGAKYLYFYSMVAPVSIYCRTFFFSDYFWIFIKK